MVFASFSAVQPVAGDNSDCVEDFYDDKIRISGGLCEKELPCDGDGVEVWLNVYDVSQFDSIRHINDFFASSESPLKFAGIFHAAVQIYNTEWKYGFTACGSGVHCGTPRKDHQHQFKQQIRLPNTLLAPRKIAKVLEELHVQYWGSEYDLLDKNCCHFADELCKRLGCGPIPSWVHRGANMGSNLRTVARSMSLGEFSMDWLASCNSESRLTDDVNLRAPRRICVI